MRISSDRTAVLVKDYVSSLSMPERHTAPRSGTTAAALNQCVNFRGGRQLVRAVDGRWDGTGLPAQAEDPARDRREPEARPGEFDTDGQARLRYSIHSHLILIDIRNAAPYNLFS
jgi:hypothetical protein